MVIDWPFFAVSCKSIFPTIVPAMHRPSRTVEMQAPSAREPSA
jgi:hypothetical protein